MYKFVHWQGDKWDSGLWRGGERNSKEERQKEI